MKSKTGDSKLSRKILTVLMLSLLGTSTVVYGVDNSIYIDQSGDNAVVNITQDGAGNRVKGLDVNGQPGQTIDPAKIKGNNVALNISQVGAGNILSLGIDTQTASGGANTAVTYSVTGASNQGIINLNNAGTNGANQSSYVNITQTDGGNQLQLAMLGTGNSFTSTQAGGGSSVTANINANTTTTLINQGSSLGGDQTTLDLTGDKGNVDIKTQGSSNVIGVTQSGGGANGHLAKVDMNGIGNNVSITQGGSIDTTVNLKSSGASNSFTINTHN